MICCWKLNWFTFFEMWSFCFSKLVSNAFCKQCCGNFINISCCFLVLNNNHFKWKKKQFSIRLFGRNLLITKYALRRKWFLFNKRKRAPQNFFSEFQGIFLINFIKWRKVTTMFSRFHFENGYVNVSKILESTWFWYR